MLMKLPMDLEKECRAGNVDHIHTLPEGLMAHDPTIDRQLLLAAAAEAGGRAEHASVMRACHHWGLEIEEGNKTACIALALAAVYTHDVDLVDFYLDEGNVDVNAVYGDEDMLVVAIGANDLPMVTRLIERGANVHTDRAFDTWPLAQAAQFHAEFEETAALRLLLQHHVKIKGSQALHEAAATGGVASVKVLLDAGADIDELSGPDFADGQRTAVWAAAESDYMDTVQVLIERGADVHIKNKHSNGSAEKPSYTPAEIARVRGHEDIAALLETAARSQNNTG